eukprot:scaffold21834_cov123-Isochrysis_galbana.AAC.5
MQGAVEEPLANSGENVTPERVHLGGEAEALLVASEQSRDGAQPPLDCLDQRLVCATRPPGSCCRRGLTTVRSRCADGHVPWGVRRGRTQRRNVALPRPAAKAGLAGSRPTGHALRRRPSGGSGGAAPAAAAAWRQEPRAPSCRGRAETTAGAAGRRACTGWHVHPLLGRRAASAERPTGCLGSASGRRPGATSRPHGYHHRAHAAHRPTPLPSPRRHQSQAAPSAPPPPPRSALALPCGRRRSGPACSASVARRLRDGRARRLQSRRWPSARRWRRRPAREERRRARWGRRRPCKRRADERRDRVQARS